MSTHEDGSPSPQVDGRDHTQSVEFGGDLREEMRRLMSDLIAHEPDMDGDGRFISSGHGYWGAGPTIAWRTACSDPLYKVGHVSIERFADNWHALCNDVGGELPGTYVSLGPGTGEKDITILRALVEMGKSVRYIGVDMSGEMLRERPSVDKRRTDPAVIEALNNAVQMQRDFSLHSEVRSLRKRLNKVVGKDTPILFSLLGNTLANFSKDQELLNSLVSGLMTHDEDRFLLEVATSTQINKEAAHRAALEYGGSQLFLSWVTSALLAYTKNLSIDQGEVQFLEAVEPRRALVLKVVYRNTSTDSMRIVLANGSDFVFTSGDTIRLELTRKYHAKAVEHLINRASLVVCGEPQLAVLDDDDGKGEFGLELLLARHNRNTKTGPTVRRGSPPFFSR